MHFEVGPRDELLDLFLALHDDGQGGCLNPANGGEVKTPVLGVERRHGPGAVNANQPVCFCPAAGGISERLHLFILAQFLKCFANGLGRHGLQPKPAYRLLSLSVLDNQSEDQLAFAPGVTGVDNSVDIFAADQLGEQLEPVLGAGDWVQVKVIGNNRQVGKRPLAPFDLYVVRRLDLKQVPNG